MATVTFIRYKSQSAGALHGVAGYVSQKQKTEQEDGWQLVKGQNCTPQLAAQEFIATRQMHRKDSPVWFYHYVQSFSPDEEITGVLAHQVAQEFAEQAWPDSEVLIATHTDAEHIHTHFIVNSVCYETGKMLRQGPSTLKNLRALSDELCMKYGFSVLEKQQPKKTKGMSSREYRSAVKGESWKFRLMNTIDQCMRYASTKEEFIALMKSEGYEVRWTDSRKNITYTTPKGMKCRDDRLHDGKYTKEVMEHEFRIRAALAHGGIEAEERFTASSNSDLSQPGGVGQFTADDQRTVSVDGRAEQGSGESGGHTEAHTALLREASSRRKPYPTQAQMEALARDVAEIRAILRQAGKRNEKRFSLRGIRLPRLSLPDIPWTSLLLGLAALALTGLVLWVVWSSLDTLWSAAKGLLP